MDFSLKYEKSRCHQESVHPQSAIRAQTAIILPYPLSRVWHLFIKIGFSSFFHSHRIAAEMWISG